MTNPPALFSLFGCVIRVHWTVGLSVPLVAGYTFATESAFAACFYSLIVVAMLGCVFLQAMMHVFLAARLGIDTRDVVLYPFWSGVRYATISERPWQEIYVSLAGPLTHGLISAVITLGLGLAGKSAAFPMPDQLNFDSTFVVFLGWCNLLMAIFHLVPVLPLDMGQVFRAALSMTSTRLHATEIACNLSTIGSLALLLIGLAWLQSPLLAYLAIALYLSSQEDLGRMRYFASIKADKLEALEPIPSIMIPMDQIVDETCKPPDERFTGFTWNRKARLWIQWLEGKAIGANALVGD
ncbi:site-2 protease family protein [Zavarzinella formosa]|uniref:site-2 protease family protein n=1 Tax=Zavarzinella formosa TaxID=360055 RepID=UPI00031E2E29|nr:site-2 protease family protein [Zavarzinella formosa]